MSILIDDDDEIICLTDNVVKTVYTDDKQLIEIIEKDLNAKTELFANTYKNIYRHYDETVMKLLTDKDELSDKIKEAYEERQVIRKELVKVKEEFENFQSKRRDMESQIDEDYQKCLNTPVDYIKPGEEAVAKSFTDEELVVITFSHKLNIGTKIAVEVSRDILRQNDVNVEMLLANPWSSKALPSLFEGEIVEIELDGNNFRQDKKHILQRCVYSLLLDIMSDPHSVSMIGVKVKYDEFAFKTESASFEIGQRVIAPLTNLCNDQAYLYKGFIIEVPKPNNVRHGNTMRVLIFFDCGIWRYVNPLLVFVFQPLVGRNTTVGPKFQDELWKNCEPFPYDQIHAKRTTGSNSQKRIFTDYPDSLLVNFSDQQLIEYLLKPKPNGKISIGFMVATNETVNTIEVRPPTRHFHLFYPYGNKTPFLHAQILENDCNMILCEWSDGVGGEKFSEWIFKGSPQIMKLYSKFNSKLLSNVSRMNSRQQQNRTSRHHVPRYQMPRHTVKKTKAQIQCEIDLTGDEGKMEDFNFLYVKDPESKANPVVQSKNHMCMSLCINYNVTEEDALTIATTPLLLRPMIFGFKRFTIANERLIRSSEADCDKIDCYYRGPCSKDIYDRAALDRYLTATSVGRFLEHDCFSFDKSVVLNRRVDKTKLKGLVDDDISGGAEPKKIPMYNQVDDQKPPPLGYKFEPVLSDHVRINTATDFMSCCECTDGCRDECPCKQLTIDGAKRINALYQSYQFGRLVDIIATGIYECGNLCLCKQNDERPCQNSIVQRGIRQELQLFKTFKKGWGIRTMCDIPFGAFICIYTGVIRKEDDAENSGRMVGDEYFANLNFIESAEATKVEVKKNMYDSGNEIDENFIQSDESGEEDFERYATGHTDIRKKLRIRKAKKKEKKSEEGSDDDGGCDVGDSDEEWSKTREYFQSEEEKDPPKGKSKRIMFVVDAKHEGNLGRYLNHSCNPNLDTQNVIINTADLRFPTVAFFAKRNIRAGEELCWDYQYELSEDPERILICECGSANCRGRLR